jgi:hypothetical protein
MRPRRLRPAGGWETLISGHTGEITVYGNFGRQLALVKAMDLCVDSAARLLTWQEYNQWSGSRSIKQWHLPSVEQL